MNKGFLWLPALLTIGIAIYKPVKEASTPKIEDKTVSLAIYKGSEYNSSIYNNSTAQVHILVEKVNTNGKRTIVWDKILSAELLSHYPSFKNAILENIQVPNVNKRKEHLEVNYILIYNSAGDELQMQGNEVISETNNSVKISI